MNKLSGKFTTGIIIILTVFAFLSALLNHKFVEKYYLHQKRDDLSLICADLSEKLKRGEETERVIKELEEANKVIIVCTDSTSGDNTVINNEIRSAFISKGIGFQQFWLWEEDYKDVSAGENRVRLYSQEKLNYSLLVKYMAYQSGLFSIVMIIPNIKDAFSIINALSAFISGVTILVSLLFIIILIRKIVFPLKQIEDFAAHMSRNEFTPLDIHTHDELEHVADTLNAMGNQIVSYQESLREKNKQMEELLDNVAHDLKTPIALIKLYSEGIRDGLDDGTFLDTVIQQDNELSHMVNQLLFTSRISKKDYGKHHINISRILENCIKEYEPLTFQNHRIISCDIENPLQITGSDQLINSLFSNLITNAILYASAPEIHIALKTEEKGIRFSISNETLNANLDLSRIWEPYFVGEQSRNKELSGTGLGLHIVRKICEKSDYIADCTIADGRITFFIILPLNTH